MKKYILSFIIPFFAIFSPSRVKAAPANFKELIQIFNVIIGALIPVLTGLAIAAFFWGAAKYIFSAGSEKAAEEGKNILFWGLIALFVLFSLWGIMRLIIGDFELRFGIPQLREPTTP